VSRSFSGTRVIRPGDENAAARSIDYAIAHEFERRSAVPERVLLTTALRQATGQAAPEEVRRTLGARDLLIHDRQGRRMVTTQDVLHEENRVIAFARGGRGACRPLGKRDRKLKRDWLNASQQAAVKHVLESRDRVILVRGVAGSGKTTLMQEVVEGIEEIGTKVRAFAPTADASRGVLR
jgi:primosomal protein N'